MARQLKTWTALSLAALGTAGVAHAEGLAAQDPSPAVILAQASADPDGEGGGEGGGALPSSYALESQDQNAFAYDARPQIEAYVDLVRASYSLAAADAQSLRRAVGALLDNPSTQTLDAARKAWVAARPSYLRTEAFRFYDGPIEEVEGEINAWPVNEAYIDYVEGDPATGIVNDPSFTLDAISLSGANQKQDEADVTVGWHAIEFLLWGQDLSAGSAGNRPYTDYVPGEAANDRRREYLRLATDKLAADLQGLADAWQDRGEKGYATRFAALPQREALGRMINGIAILAGFEFMSERLAVALDSGDQEDEHSCFSDTTKQDFVHDLLGIRQVWTGDADGVTRTGLNDLVRAQDAALADRLDQLFADAEAKVNALGDPWDQVLASPKDSSGRQAAEQAVASLQALADGLVAAGNRLGVLVLLPSG